MAEVVAGRARWKPGFLDAWENDTALNVVLLPGLAVVHREDRPVGCGRVRGYVPCELVCDDLGKRDRSA
jgi:hypothetical protein